MKNKLSVLEKLSLLHEELGYALTAKTGEPEPKRYFQKFKQMERSGGWVGKFIKALWFNYIYRGRRLEELECLFNNFYKENEGGYSTLGRAGSLLETGDELRRIAMGGGDNECFLPCLNLDEIMDLMGFVGYVKKELEFEAAADIEEAAKNARYEELAGLGSSHKGAESMSLMVEEKKTTEGKTTSPADDFYDGEHLSDSFLIG